MAEITGCVLVACLSAVFIAPVKAQGANGGATNATTAAAPPVVTLQQAIGDALKFNPEILAASHDQAAAMRQVGTTKGLLYGELDAVASGQHLNYPQLLEPMEGPLTPAASAAAPFAQDQLHLGVAYTYPLYIGGRITNQVRIAELGVERAKALLTGTRSDIAYNVTALFAQAQALSAQADAIQNEITELDTTLHDLELAVKIGKRPDVDRLEVVDRVSEAHSALTGVLGQHQQVVASLMAVMGRDPAKPVDLAPLPDRLPVLGASESVLSEAAAKRSSVRATEIVAAQDQRKIAVARGAMDPNVALQASYLQHADPSYLGQSRDSWFVGFQVSMPLFDGGVRRSELAQAKEQAAAAAQRVEAARLQSAAQLKGAMALWQSAQDQLVAAQAQYASAHEVARIQQLKFDLGAGDIEDLLRARTREVEAQSAVAAARSEIIVSGAQVNHITENEVVR